MACVISAAIPSAAEVATIGAVVPIQTGDQYRHRLYGRPAEGQSTVEPEIDDRENIHAKRLLLLASLPSNPMTLAINIRDTK